MSLQNMNTLRLIPKKDYEQNRLLAGRLQLSPNTHLVLDETVMTEGIRDFGRIIYVRFLTNSPYRTVDC